MIARIIAGQLGGNALALLGAHTLVDIGDGLQFRIQGSESVNLIQIILDPCDTYTVKFCKLQAVEKTNLGITYTEMTWEVVKAVRDVVATNIICPPEINIIWPRRTHVTDRFLLAV